MTNENIKLNFAHICDAAFLSQEGKMNIIGDFDRINAKKIPGMDKIFHNFFIVTNFTINVPGEYEQKILIKSDDSEQKLALDVIAKNVVKAAGKTGFIGNFGVIFPKYGKYKVEIYIDKELKVQLPLTVLDAENKNA